MALVDYVSPDEADETAGAILEAYRDEHIDAEVGETVAGHEEGRTSEDERILFWHNGFPSATSCSVTSRTRSPPRPVSASR